MNNAVSNSRYRINKTAACVVLIGLICTTGIAHGARAGKPGGIGDLLDFDKLVFVKRYTYQSNHYYTDFINGCENFGGNICILNLRDGSVTDG